MEDTHYRPLRPIHLLIAVGLFCLFFVLSYPYYRYFVDPDAVAYLTIAKRTAAGDYWRLVNALWSPLHPTMVALCVKGGMDALLAAQLTNAGACVLILIASYGLFRRFRVSRDVGVFLLPALAFFLTYALYMQLFCDLWQVALLLLYLSLITSEQFIRKPLYWIACGLLMALAAYAKVYSFYFLLLHFPLALWRIKRRDGLTAFPVKAYLTAFLFQLLLLTPWIGLMHQKYGGWDLSKSGALNTSWTLNGHKSPKPNIGALIPPPYPNSPYTWEDPYLTEATLHTRFESLAMIKSQIGHSIQSALQGIEAAGQISPFLLITLLGTAVAMFSKRGRILFSENQRILLLAAAIMPVGYLLLHFEARYIWLLLFIGMIFGAFWLERFRPYILSRRLFAVTVLVFAASFMVWPLHGMKVLFRSGEDMRAQALALRSIGINGSFTTNDNPSRSGLLAYWMDGNYYTPVRENLTHEEVLSEMRRYHIKYYLFYNSKMDATLSQLPDEAGQPFPEVSGGKIPGVRVFLVTP
jgi:hypothetical protein